MRYSAEDHLRVYAAVIYIKRMYKRIYKVTPIIKWSNEELHYVNLDLWCPYNEDDPEEHILKLELLAKLVLKAVFKHHSIGAILVENFIDLLPVDEDSTVYICWISGYMTRIWDQYTIEDENMLMLGDGNE